MAAYTLTRLTTDGITKVFTPRAVAGAQEDSYQFIDNKGIGGAVIEFTCTVIWNFRTTTGGDNYPVAAGVPFRATLDSSQTVFGSISAAGTMSMVMVGSA